MDTEDILMTLIAFDIAGFAAMFGFLFGTREAVITFFGVFLFVLWFLTKDCDNGERSS